MSVPPRILGLLIAFIGVVLLSPDAAVSQLFDGNIWTIVFWRALGSALVLGFLSVIVLRYDILSYFKNLHWTGWIAVLMFGYGPVLWLSAVTYAGGATVLALLAFAPLVAALGDWLILGERIKPFTIICSIAALIGVIWTVWDGIFSSDISLFGLALAVAIPINHALMFVLFRVKQQKTTWPILSLGSFILVPVAFFLAPTIALTTSAQIWSAIAMIAFVSTLSFALISLATHYVSASDIMLVNLLEPVIGVMFLWLIVRELPTQNQWIGGGIVIISVAAFAGWQVWHEREKSHKS